MEPTKWEGPETPGWAAVGAWGAPQRESSAAAPETKKPRSACLKTHDRHLFRRLTSERQLEETLDWEFEEGTAYHVISGGDIDSLSFLKHALRQQPLEYLAMSKWCMALRDIEELERFISLGRIGRLDSYVGEIFKGSYMKEHARLSALHARHGGRIAVFRNHSKVFCGFGAKFDFVVESSANVNTNPRTENTVITVGTPLALFYKGFFDGIRSFERDFDGWQPYSLRRG